MDQGMQGLTPLHEAQKTVLDSARPLGLEKIGLLEALGSRAGRRYHCGSR